MKFTWEPEDIICGRFICTKQPHSNSDMLFFSKYVYKIGYQGGSSNYRPATGELGESGVCLIAMSDGMVTGVKTSAELTKEFNERGYIPCPHEILMGVMEALRDSYQTPLKPAKNI